MQEQIKIYFHGQYKKDQYTQGSKTLLAYPGTTNDLETQYILEGRKTIERLNCVTEMPDCVYNLMRKKDFGTYYSLITPSASDDREGFVSIIIVIREGYRVSGEAVYKLLNLLNERIHKAKKIFEDDAIQLVEQCVEELGIQCQKCNPISWENPSQSDTIGTCFRLYNTEEELRRYLDLINQPVYQNYRDVCFVYSDYSPKDSKQAVRISEPLKSVYTCERSGKFEELDVSWIISLDNGSQDFITGACATIRYTKPKYEPIKKSFTVGANSPYVTISGDMIVVNPPLPSDKFKKVLKIQLVDERDKSVITNASLTISSVGKSSYSSSRNGTFFEAILEEDPSDTTVTINVNTNGYEPETRKVKFIDISSDKPEVFNLKKKRNEVCIILYQGVLEDDELEKELARAKPSFHGIPVESDGLVDGKKVYTVKEPSSVTGSTQSRSKKKHGKPNPNGPDDENSEVGLFSKLVDRLGEYMFEHKKSTILIFSIIVCSIIYGIVATFLGEAPLLKGCVRGATEPNDTTVVVAEVGYNPKNEADNLMYMQSHNVWRGDSLQSDFGKQMFAVMTTGQIGSTLEDTYGNGAYNNQLNETYKKIKEAWKTLSASGQAAVAGSIRKKYSDGANSEEVDLQDILGLIEAQQQAEQDLKRQPNAVSSAPVTGQTADPQSQPKPNFDPALQNACQAYNKAYAAAQNAKAGLKQGMAQTSPSKKGRNSAGAVIDGKSGDKSGGGSDDSTALNKANAKLQEAYNAVYNAYKKAYPNEEPKMDRLRNHGLNKKYPFTNTIK